MNDMEILHSGRYSASSLGCPRAQALHILGHEAVIPRKLQTKFDEGHEHDEEMKREAEEEFDDFYVPESRIIRLTRGPTIAEIVVTPDGLREREIVEFKGLSASFWNALRTEEDLKTGSDLTKKYYEQAQAYAGAYGKPLIRFRIKNKKNLKVRDIIFKASPRIWKEIKSMIMDIQELLDKGELPPKECTSEAAKKCLYRKACVGEVAKEVEMIPEKPLSLDTRSKLTRFVESYLAIKGEIAKQEMNLERFHSAIKEIMKTHGQKEQELVPGTVKYGIRYKTQKNKEDIEALVAAGRIGVEDKPEEYCSVYPTGEEE